MQVWDAIRNKRAVRQFKDEPLREDEIRRILDAGRRSQSSKNGQPWQFVAVQERATLEAIGTDNLWHVAGSALCVVMLMPAENERTVYNFFDIGQSAAFMQLAALEQGIGSCLGTIYDPEKLRDLLGFPPEWQARMLLSFGYPTEGYAPSFNKDKRNTFDDVVHWERW
jgi:nitroreductase